MVYGFVNSGLMDEIAFMRLARKSILRNSHELNWKDLPMILTVAGKLKLQEKSRKSSQNTFANVQLDDIDKQQIEIIESEDFIRFKQTIGESIETLID
jgi:hypothetical protein